MEDIDDVDRKILELLLENSRRPYSEIADIIDMSAPAISDRVAKLRESGVIQRFTLQLDPTQPVDDGVPVLVHVRLRPGAGDELYSALAEDTDVEYTFSTVAENVYFTTVAPPDKIKEIVLEKADAATIDEVNVELLVDAVWNP